MILGLLGVAFVVLKIIGIITWSWWLVLLPFYIGLAILLVIALFAVGGLSVLGIFTNWQLRRAQKSWSRKYGSR